MTKREATHLKVGDSVIWKPDGAIGMVIATGRYVDSEIPWFDVRWHGTGPEVERRYLIAPLNDLDYIARKGETR